MKVAFVRFPTHAPGCGGCTPGFIASWMHAPFTVLGFLKVGGIYQLTDGVLASYDNLIKRSFFFITGIQKNSADTTHDIVGRGKNRGSRKSKLTE